MTKEVKMPSAGQTTDEAVVCSILVRIGDAVKRGDTLLEAETDKATLPVESFADGIVIDVLVSEGDTVDAGTPLVVLGSEADKATYKRAEKVGNGEAESVSGQTAAETEEDEYQPILVSGRPVKATKAPEEIAKPINEDYKAMPNAKRMAREAGVDLRLVKPATGEIVKRSDVEAYMASAVEDLNCYEVMKISRMRNAIGQRMSQSFRDIPQFQITISVDMTNAIALKDGIFASKNAKISYNDIMCLVLSKVAKEFTLLNARYEEDEIRIYKHTSVGIAVGLKDALVVPVAKDVDKMSILEIAAVNKENIKKAREGALVPSDMGCGTLSISNLGMFDVKGFTAIVNPPESCIFAVSSIETRPFWNGSTFVPRQMSDITVSFDHRMIDGSYGAQMLKKFKSLMENPALLLAE